MKVYDLWWECPKCGSKVKFGYELATLFDEEDNQAWFESDSGVPFYNLKCDNKECNARWTFGISKMYERE